MLIYLASYPRSGNHWSQNLIRYYFDQQIDSVYVENRRKSILEQAGENAANTASSMGRYFLTPALRQILAEQEKHTFIKTHELPFDDYFTGERVIHIVRHPGAAFWSYSLFLQDVDHNPVPLDGLIRGDYGFNGWSTHTEQWSALGQSLGDHYLRYQFEQLQTEESMICQAISKLTGLPFCNPLGTFPAIDHWRTIRPDVVRKGTVNEWQENFTPAQCRLLLRCHGETMAKFGYLVEPSLLSPPDEQAPLQDEEATKPIANELPEQKHHKVTPPSVPWHRKYLRPVIRPIYQMMPRQSLMLATLFHKASFALKVSTESDVILHITHPKAGSQWVAEVLKSCVAPQRLVLPLPHVAHFKRTTLRPGGVYLAVFRAQQRVAEVTRGFPHPLHKVVIIRDLRDTFVSFYFSLRYSHVEIGGVKPARTQLSQMSEEEGLMYLLSNKSMKELQASPIGKTPDISALYTTYRVSRLQKSWLEGNDHLLIRYEELVANEYNTFQRIMDYCKVDVDKKHLRSIVASNSFETRTGRKPGQEDIMVHQRKGIVGDWRNHFTDQIKGEFKERYGDILIDTGYEENLNW